MSESPIDQIMYLGDILERCDFQHFWDRVVSMSELCDRIVGFQDSIRKFVCHVVGITFQTIDRGLLAQLLGGVDGTIYKAFIFNLAQVSNFINLVSFAPYIQMQHWNIGWRSMVGKKRIKRSSLSPIKTRTSRPKISLKKLILRTWLVWWLLVCKDVSIYFLIKFTKLSLIINRLRVFNKLIDYGDPCPPIFSWFL